MKTTFAPIPDIVADIPSLPVVATRILQIIASAHSPWLLDQLQPEQIRLMTLDEDGYAVCGKLTDPFQPFGICSGRQSQKGQLRIAHLKTGEKLV